MGIDLIQLATEKLMRFTNILLLAATLSLKTLAGDGTLPLISVKTQIIARSNGVRLACHVSKQEKEKQTYVIHFDRDKKSTFSIEMKSDQSQLKAFILQNNSKKEIQMIIPQNDLEVESLSAGLDYIQEITIGFDHQELLQSCL